MIGDRRAGRSENMGRDKSRERTWEGIKVERTWEGRKVDGRIFK